MKDLGMYKGVDGLELLLQELQSVLREKEKAVVAIAGLPGVGKTWMVKRFVRMGFGNFHRKDILVIDDNTIYTSRFWKLKWEKIRLEKKSFESFLRLTDAKVVFFSNWIPSRFMSYADMYVILELSEQKRVERLKRRERKTPEKFRIHEAKNAIPLEEPFSCPAKMILANYSEGVSRWHFIWAMKRLFSSRHSRILLLT